MSNNFNPTNLIYLFFLKYPLKYILDSVPAKYALESQAFMFQVYLNDNTTYNWDRLFYVYENYAEDFDFGLQLSNLMYHEFINEEGILTEKGEKYLEEQLNKHAEFSKYLYQFYHQNQTTHFLQGTFMENRKFKNQDDFVPVCLPYKK